MKTVFTQSAVSLLCPGKLKDRLGKFNLEIAEDKTKNIEFGRFGEERRNKRGQGKPETFDFLG